MTRKDLRTVTHEYKLGIALLGSGFLAWAGSLYIDDWRDKVDLPALIAASWGFFEMVLKKRDKKVSSELNSTVAGTVASTVEQSVNTAIDKEVHDLTVAVVKLGSGLEGMRAEVAERHADNKQDHAALLESLAADQQRNAELHAEHKTRIDKLEGDVKDMRQEVGDEIRKLGEKIDSRQ